MDRWQKSLPYNPLPGLLSGSDPALEYFVRRDLLGESPGPVERLWVLPAARRLLSRQRSDGSWPRSGEIKHPAINYPLIETWRNLRYLVQQYGFTCAQPQLAQAAEYVFSCQTEAGDLRGMLANQYATYYTGAILGLLIQAGYATDPRVQRGLSWLLSMRQDDGGWTIPLLTHQLDRDTQYRLTSELAPPLEPDRSKPFSHNWTGMVLRAFAAHPNYRGNEDVQAAGRLLVSRFFQPDAYTSYQAASYWLRFEYPFWWNNLVSALDTLSLLGFPSSDPSIRRGLDWLMEHQQPDGLWLVTYAKTDGPSTPKTRLLQFWITLAICRIFQRLT